MSKKRWFNEAAIFVAIWLSLTSLCSYMYSTLVTGLTFYAKPYTLCKIPQHTLHCTVKHIFLFMNPKLQIQIVKYVHNGKDEEVKHF